MRPWTRLWHDMPTDPKWRVVAKRSGRPLTEVMALFTLMLTAAADDGVLNGWASEDAAAALDMDLEHVEAIVTAMQGKVLDGELLTGWAKRQPKREDDSRERVRAHRERKKQQRNAEAEPRNADVTQRNAPEEETDTEIETEENTFVRSEFVAAPARTDGRTAAYGDLKNWFNGATETMLEFIDGCMGPGDNRANSEQWLASTVSAHGQNAVSQAFAMLVEKRAGGIAIARPLAHWSNLANTLKAGRSRPPPAANIKPGGVFEALQRRKQASADKEFAQ